ncbi:unnamed protein product [Allacma fusca]|uniref:Uncharacterized protein n=1 Tax=Allacma fusca TaxID=39272 RepID=A0A8J2JTE8_9HEXA|nr:unnamed protein product [Allacma fusca]
MESRTKILEMMQVAANLIKSMHQTYPNFGVIKFNFHSLTTGPDGNIHSTELEDNSYTPMGHQIPVYYLLAYLYRTCPAEAKLRIQQFGDRFIGLGSPPETRFTKPEKQFMAEYIRQNGYNLALLRRNHILE